MGVTRIIPELHSQDLAATEELYTTVLGLEVQMRDKPDFVMFGSATAPTAQLVVNDNGHAGLPRGFAIDVGDRIRVNQIHDEISRRGLRIIEPLATTPWGIRRFSFLDHDSERITVLAHVDAE